jgi:hypothetical protein
MTTAVFVETLEHLQDTTRLIPDSRSYTKSLSFLNQNFVLVTTEKKMTVFWDVAPCNVVEIGRRFRGAYCFHHHGLLMAISTSETSVNFYETTRCNIPEDSHIHTRHVRTWNLTLPQKVTIWSLSSTSSVQSRPSPPASRRSILVCFHVVQHCISCFLPCVLYFPPISIFFI